MICRSGKRKSIQYQIRELSEIQKQKNAREFHTSPMSTILQFHGSTQSDSQPLATIIDHSNPLNTGQFYAFIPFNYTKFNEH